MLACLLKHSGKVSLEKVPVPKIQPGDVLVRLKAGGICGTDLEKIRGGYGPGGILGHEVSGIIDKVGSKVRGLQPGDRVVAHHHVPCYNCNLCKAGDHTMCDMFRKTNLDPCGFAELFRVPEYNVERGAVIRIPDSMTFDEAALLEPTACCIRALEKAKMKPGENVIVIGLGPTGLTHIQLLKHLKGGQIIGTDIQLARLEMAGKMGAAKVLNPTIESVADIVSGQTTDGVDLAIVSTGNTKALTQAFDLVRKGGRILLFGAPPTGATIPLDVGSLFGRQVSLITSYSCVEADIARALDLATRHEIDLTSLITNRFTLSEALDAFKLAGSPTAGVKTMIQA